jgi:hypothetical protein
MQATAVSHATTIPLWSMESAWVVPQGARHALTHLPAHNAVIVTTRFHPQFVNHVQQAVKHVLSPLIFHVQPAQTDTISAALVVSHVSPPVLHALLLLFAPVASLATTSLASAVLTALLIAPHALIPHPARPVPQAITYLAPPVSPALQIVSHASTPLHARPVQLTTL